jgi:hypothetical protein
MVAPPLIPKVNPCEKATEETNSMIASERNLVFINEI